MSTQVDAEKIVEPSSIEQIKSHLGEFLRADSVEGGVIVDSTAPEEIEEVLRAAQEEQATGAKNRLAEVLGLADIKPDVEDTLYTGMYL